MIRVLVFSGFGLEIDGVSRGAELARRLAAVLAILAAHGTRGIGRDRLLHLLWSESDPTRARHALTQTLYSLRRLLGGDEALVGTAQLALNSELVSSDAFAFERAMESRDVEAAIAAYRGPFLDGFTVNGAPEFERWVEERRLAYARELGDLLERSAEQEEEKGDFEDASQLLRRRAALDPLDANSALQLMRVLARAGDVTGAIQHSRIYGELVRQQLELEPDIRVVELERELERGLIERDNAPTAVQEATQHLPAPVAIPTERVIAWVGAATKKAADSVRHARNWWRSRSLAWRANVLRSGTGILIAVGAILLAVKITRMLRTPDRSGGVVVLPFRASAVAPELSFLSAGIPELLSSALAERDTLPVIGVEQMQNWWRSTFPGRGYVVSDSAVRAARSLGVRRAITGSVVGNGERLVLQANVVDVDGFKVLASATADAPLDSLSPLVERLATLLVADEAGAADEVVRLARVTPEGLRAFIDGRAAYSGGDFRLAQQHFTSALTHDSTFAAAAIGLALASDWLDDVRARTVALDLARSRTGLLSNESQQQLSALLGSRYPAPLMGAEFAAGWERVAAGSTARAEPLLELGRRLMADGDLAGTTNSRERARIALQRALERDSSLIAARRLLTVLSLDDGNADGVPRSLFSADTSDALYALALRVAAVRSDAAALAGARERMSQVSNDALRRTSLTSLYYGLHLSDGVRANELRRARSAASVAGGGTGSAMRLDVLLAQHAFALNGGSSQQALEAARALQDEPASDGAHLRLQVLDAIYSDGDSAAAGEAVERLEQRTAGALGASTDERSVRLADICVLEQWRIWHGDFSTTESSIRMLSRPEATRFTAPVISGGAACAILIEAIAEGLRELPRAEDAMARAEGLAMVGPTAGDLWQYGTLALAKVQEHRGEIGRALELVRRRSSARGWPRYLSSYLRMEARLSREQGDTAGARAALRHFLALREGADGNAAQEADSLRGVLRELGSN